VGYCNYILSSIELSIGVAYDSLNFDTKVKDGTYDTILEFSKQNLRQLA
jgi:hypothetical protein